MARPPRRQSLGFKEPWGGVQLTARPSSDIAAAPSAPFNTALPSPILSTRIGPTRRAAEATLRQPPLGESRHRPRPMVVLGWTVMSASGAPISIASSRVRSRCTCRRPKTSRGRPRRAAACGTRLRTAQRRLRGGIQRHWRLPSHFAVSFPREARVRPGHIVNTRRTPPP